MGITNSLNVLNPSSHIDYPIHTSSITYTTNLFTHIMSLPPEPVIPAASQTDSTGRQQGVHHGMAGMSDDQKTNPISRHEDLCRSLWGVVSEAAFVCFLILSSLFCECPNDYLLCEAKAY